MLYVIYHSCQPALTRIGGPVQIYVLCYMMITKPDQRVYAHRSEGSWHMLNVYVSKS
jgi:hypothetical protein